MLVDVAWFDPVVMLVCLVCFGLVGLALGLAWDSSFAVCVLSFFETAHVYMCCLFCLFFFKTLTIHFFVACWFLLKLWCVMRFVGLSFFVVL